MICNTLSFNYNTNVNLKNKRDRMGRTDATAAAGELWQKR